MASEQQINASENFKFDLNAQFSPAVLAGIIGVSPANIYQLQQQGRLPLSGSYREAIRKYISYWKQKATNKGSSIHEIGQARKSELDRAKTELAWLTVKKEREQLVDIEAFASVFTPAYMQMKMQLVALTRQDASLQEPIDKILESWAVLGERYTQEATQEMEHFVEAQINELETLEQDSADLHADKEDGIKPRDYKKEPDLKDLLEGDL